MEEKETKEGKEKEETEFVREYSFDFLDPNSTFSYDKGYLKLVFIGYEENDIDRVMKKNGEKIKEYIKEVYSLKVYGKKHNTKTLWGKIYPIKMLNFQELKMSFLDDPQTYVIMESLKVKKGIPTFDIE